MRVIFFPLVLYALRTSAALLPRASSTPSCTYTCGPADQDGFANYPGYTTDNAGTLHCEYPDPTTHEQNQYICEYNDVRSSIFMIMNALTCASQQTGTLTRSTDVRGFHSLRRARWMFS
jgi:hypothetical protein